MCSKVGHLRHPLCTPLIGVVDSTLKGQLPAQMALGTALLGNKLDYTPRGPLFLCCSLHKFIEGDPWYQLYGRTCHINFVRYGWQCVRSASLQPHQTADRRLISLWHSSIMSFSFNSKSVPGILQLCARFLCMISKLMAKALWLRKFVRSDCMMRNTVIEPASAIIFILCIGRTSLTRDFPSGHSPIELKHGT